MNQQNTSFNKSVPIDLLTTEDRQFINYAIVASITSEVEAFTDKLMGKKEEQTITLFEFHDQLVDHDWYYSYSDCSETQSRAYRNLIRLETIALCHYTFATHLSQFKRWAGVNFNSPCPRPERPEKDVLIKHNYVKPYERKMISVYCCMGCNVLRIPKEQKTDECASCGSIMREEYEDSFCDAHEPDVFPADL